MSAEATSVVHIIQQLGLGGAGRALIAAAKYSAKCGNFRHSVVSLLAAHRPACMLAAEAGLDVLASPDETRLIRVIEQADIVQLHFWNAPELYQLLSGDLPAMRSVMWCHVNCAEAPHVPTEELLGFPDVVVASTELTLTLPGFRALGERVALIPGGADFERVARFQRVAHPEFNVGYIGLLDFGKMHPDYVAMSAAVDVSSARFIVCGDGADAHRLRRQADELGVAERFEFLGYTEQIGAVIGRLDVFGYPLCEENYTTSDLVLQEVMNCGVPPVVLPFGGAARLVVHGESGLVARDATEYARAIAYLHGHPEERERLGRNAAARAREFGGENTARRFNALYERLLRHAKRKRDPLPSGPPAAASAKPPLGPGAWSLVRSLGTAAQDFRISLTAARDEDAVAAEERVARARPGVGDVVLQYRRCYGSDGQVCLWAGLVLLGRGRAALAAGEFRRAIDRGCDHWRVFWYLGRAAEAAGSDAIAAEAFARARAAAPQFVGVPGS